MATWKSKLERVASIGPAPRAAPAPAPAPAPVPSASIDELRERIARLLGKPPPERPAPADPTFGDLPFVREETALGPLYVRARKLSAAHRVGRAPVAAACDAASGMLALLALDPSLSACDPRRALYLDTETTGLSGGAGTVPFLVGLAWFEPGTSTLVVEQLLLRQLGEEAPILDRLLARVRDASMLVSFNGKSFDLPLLRTRTVLCRMPELPARPHLDLVHVARRVHKKRLGTCDLATIEARVLGFRREGDIPSGEVVGRYAHFLRTRDELALVAVVEHNDWDVVAMAALVGLYGEPLDGWCSSNTSGSSIVSPEGSALRPASGAVGAPPPGLGPRAPNDRQVALHTSHFQGMHAADLVGVARTLRRAGSLELAESVVEAAVERGGGGEAVRARGEIAKARGDKARALAAYAAVIEEIDDAGLRLELAKLYEHHAKEPLRALELVERGTGETAEKAARRRGRLVRKLKG